MESYGGTSDDRANGMQEMWQSSHIVQGTQVHTESSEPGIGEQTTIVSDQHPIPVHFSCHGRRKNNTSQNSDQIKDEGGSSFYSTKKDETPGTETEIRRYAPGYDNLPASSHPAGCARQSTEVPIHIDDECRPEPEAKEIPEKPDEDALNTEDTGVGLGRRKRGCEQGTTQPKHTLSIASLNVKNFKTNQTY